MLKEGSGKYIGPYPRVGDQSKGRGKQGGRIIKKSGPVFSESYAGWGGERGGNGARREVKGYFPCSQLGVGQSNEEGRIGPLFLRKHGGENGGAARANVDHLVASGANKGRLDTWSVASLLGRKRKAEFTGGERFNIRKFKIRKGH